MKKIYIIIVFLLCAVGAYYLTTSLRSCGGKKQASEVSEKDNVNDTNQVLNTKSAVAPVEKNVTRKDSPVNIQKGEIKKPDAKKEPAKKEDAVKKHVNISFEEMKKLITSGRYERDSRLSKKYTIKYTEVNDDDMDGLQQNFTFIQQQVEFENWRGFDVVGLDYDERGLVNSVTIKPIY